MTTIELKQHPDMKRLIQAAFPNYKKHRAFVSEFRSMNINSYWDGGSRSEYVLLHVPTMRRVALPTNTHPFYDVARYGIQGENQWVSVSERGNITLNVLPADFVIVEAGYFCGKPSTAHVFLAPKPALTENTVPMLTEAI